jgi:hypothetical protein
MLVEPNALLTLTSNVPAPSIWECPRILFVLLHEQINTNDPTHFDFVAYCALEERLARYIYSIKEKVQKDDKRPSWPFGPPHVKPSSTLLPCYMAGAGWVCQQERRTPDLVVCHKCGVEKSEWKEGECPRKVHEQLSPSCTFSFENTEEVLCPYIPFRLRRGEVFHAIIFAERLCSR